MDNYIKIINDEGVEVLAEVLFTFEHKGNNFVLLTESKEYDDLEEAAEIEADVLAYKYEELEDGTIGNLIEIDSASDWEVVEEMFNTFNAEEIKQDELEEDETE